MRRQSPTLLALLAALFAAAAAQDYFLNCGSADDHTRFVTVPSDTASRVASRAPIRGATSQYLYQNHRTTDGSATSFTYVLPPRRPGTYLIELAFAEIADPASARRCSVGARRFNVLVQTRRVLSDFDVFAKAGCRRATRERTTTVVGADRRLAITFQAGSAGRPMVSYIKAVFQGSATATPTATTTSAATTTDPRETSCRGLGHIRRKEVNSLTNTEWRNYVAAVATTRNRMNGAVSWYDWFSAVHNDAALHNQAAFLPWHRSMLFNWEVQLHAGVPGVRQPYFDWSQSASNLFSNQAFGTTRFGGTSNNGAFSDVVVAAPGGRHPLARSFDRTVQVATRPYLDTLIRTQLDFTRFRVALESAHDAFHRAVGGDMLTLHSPNDPLFYAHHAFIDYVGQEWIDRNGQSSFSGIGGVQMAPWQENVNTVMEEFTACVTYEGSGVARAMADPLPGVGSGVISKEEIDGRANQRASAVFFGASDADLALLDEVNAEISAIMGIESQTSNVSPMT